MTPTTLADYLDDAEPGDPNTAAKALTDRILDEGRADLFVGLVAAELRARWRTTVHRVERQAMPPHVLTAHGLTEQIRGVEARIDDFRVLLGLHFSVDSTGRVVTWGQATVRDHETRAAELERQAAAVAETAARHRLAAGIIEARGATCLDAVFGVVR